MVIDLRKLKLKGIFDGDFDFEFNPSDDVLSIPGAKINDCVRVKGNFEVDISGKVYVYGDISFVILGECSRCLTPTIHNVTIPFDETFSQRKNDEDCYQFSKDILDLTQMVNELILLESPTVIYCNSNCLGLCPHCGKNLNLGSCDCGDNL